MHCTQIKTAEIQSTGNGTNYAGLAFESSSPKLSTCAFQITAVLSSHSALVSCNNVRHYDYLYIPSCGCKSTLSEWYMYMWAVASVKFYIEHYYFLKKKTN